MFKKTLCAVAIMAAATTGAYAKCSAAKGDTVKKFDNVAHVLTVAMNSLENVEDATASKDMKCAQERREAYTADYLPQVEKIATGTVEPVVRLKAAPLVTAYKAALQDGIELEEMDKRINAFYEAVREYQQTAVKSAWKYESDKDEMRGITTHYWFLASNDSVKLEWPYKDAKARILVFQREEKGVVSKPQITVSVSDGQLSYSRRDAEITAKFDDEEPSEYDGGLCGDSHRQFCFGGYFGGDIFYIRAKNSSAAIVELDFYQNGKHQFHFNTAGLNVLRVTPDFKKASAKK